jgi:hypothetical protein
MKTNVRTTVSLDREDHELLLEIAEKNGWPVGKTATLAIKALGVLMDAHTAYADQHPDVVAELYIRLAREAPAAFVEVPKDGVKVGRLGDQPAVQLGNWLVTDLDGDLMAEELDGERRLGKVIDGEIKPLRAPSAMTAAKFN